MHALVDAVEVGGDLLVRGCLLGLEDVALGVLILDLPVGLILLELPGDLGRASRRLHHRELPALADAFIFRPLALKRVAVCVVHRPVKLSQAVAHVALIQLSIRIEYLDNAVS